MDSPAVPPSKSPLELVDDILGLVKVLFYLLPLLALRLLRLTQCTPAQVNPCVSELHAPDPVLQDLETKLKCRTP
jgi:hypothetical protein